MFVSVCVRAHAYVRALLRACVRWCVCVFVCVCVCVSRLVSSIMHAGVGVLPELDCEGGGKSKSTCVSENT